MTNKLSDGKHYKTRKGITMKKERIITRTIKMTYASIITLNIETNEVSTSRYCVCGVFDDEKQALERFKETYETDSIKFVYITEMETIEKLYGITEENFIYWGFEMEPRKVNTNDDI